MTENTFKLLKASFETGRPIQSNHSGDIWCDCPDPSFQVMDAHPSRYRIKPVEPEQPSPELVNYGRWMAAQAMIDEALKALGQTKLLKRVEELECLVDECVQALVSCNDGLKYTGTEALIARCNEALK